MLFPPVILFVLIRKVRLMAFCGELRLDQRFLNALHKILNKVTCQELLCKGWFLPPNTYDCGSFVVNETAVVGKEQNNPYNH